MKNAAPAERHPPVTYYQQTRPEVVCLVDAPGLRILEVGCAEGAMGASLLARGAREVVGLDLFAPAIAEARTRLTAAHRVDLNALPELPYPNGYFDLITCADVLEHLVDPAAVLRHLRRWLADDGRVLVSIPNVRHESVVLPLLVNGEWEYRDCGILDRTHLRFYTRTGILHLLADAGFKLDGRFSGVQSGTPTWATKAAELVEALGGDGGRWLDECDVVQFVFFARPTGRLASGGAGRSRSAVPDRAENTNQITADAPWAGSKAVRILFAPEPGDAFATALPPLARALSGAAATIGIALSPETKDLAIPDAGDVDLDVLLLEAPEAGGAWDPLLRGVNLVVLTNDRPELAAAARRMGVDVRDARTDGELGGVGTARPVAQPGDIT